MRLNYHIDEGESPVITIITDALPVTGSRVRLPLSVVQRHWPTHTYVNWLPYFMVNRIQPLDDENFNIYVTR